MYTGWSVYVPYLSRRLSLYKPQLVSNSLSAASRAKKEKSFKIAANLASFPIGQQKRERGEKLSEAIGEKQCAANVYGIYGIL